MASRTYRSVGGYSVHIAEDVLRDLPEELRLIASGRRVLIVTTPTVARQYGGLQDFLTGAARSVRLEILDIDEHRKTMTPVLQVCRAAQAAGLSRHDLVMAVGGGVCSDVARAAASILHRGVKHVCIPTTLIGQIDAALGVKAGLNFEGRKSFLGVFRAPEAVFADPGFLHTLAPRHIRDGLAEIVKLAVALDSQLFDLVEQTGPALVATRFAAPRKSALRIIHRSVELTQAELDADLYEEGALRRLLDFGHTFSPLIEEATGFLVSHGQAVMIDMCLSSAIAAALGYLSDTDVERIIALARDLRLPTDHPCLDASLMSDAIMAAIRRRNGALNLVVPEAIGRGRFVAASELPPALLDQALARLRRGAFQVQAAELAAAE